MVRDKILNYLMVHDKATVNEIYENTSINITEGDWKKVLNKELRSLVKYRSIYKVGRNSYRIDQDVKYHREKNNGQIKMF